MKICKATFAELASTIFIL